MERFERELHEYVVAVEREGLAEELTRLDVDLPAPTGKPMPTATTDMGAP